MIVAANVKPPLLSSLKWEFYHTEDCKHLEICFRMLSHQTRKEKLVSSIKYLEFQVQKLINLNCVTKFR